MIVFLARHASHDEIGRVLSGRSEIALNADGEAEAERLAARLADVPLAAVHSSPRRRTWQTAEIVAARHDLPVTRADALDEVDFGRWAGRDFAELESDPYWQRWNAARGTASTPAGETMANVAARATVAITALAGEQPILCLSHGDVIRAVAAQVIGLSFDRLTAFDLDLASLTTLTVENGCVRLTTLNERPQ